MPYSDRQTETFLKEFITQNYRSESKLLDIGAGAGANYEILKDYYNIIDCIEVFTPYIERFGLTKKYRNVFNVNVLDFDNFCDYDLLIMGDVLEHLSVVDAISLLKRITELGVPIIIQVPFMYQQGVYDGNVYEIHLQDDLTESVMASRYSEYLQHIHTQDYLGIYTNVINLHTKTLDKIEVQAFIINFNRLLLPKKCVNFYR